LCGRIRLVRSLPESNEHDRSSSWPLTAKALTLRESGPHTNCSLALSVELAGFALWDSGERTNSKDLFDRAFELHKVAVESIGSEPQIPDSNGAIDSKNPQARRDLTVPPATSANASEQSAASGRSTVASTLPSLVFKAEPTYTEMARVFKISGSVQLSIVVGRSGRAESIQLLQGLGLGLDEQAARTVRTWRFQPGTRAGQPVSVRAKIEVNFRLL